MSTAAGRNHEPDAGAPAQADAPAPGGQLLPFQRAYPDTPEFAGEVVLSRIICMDTRAQAVGDIYEALQTIRAYGATHLPGAPACWPAPPPSGRGPRSVLRALGLTRQELITKEWRPPYHDDRQYARLPSAILHALYWPSARAAMDLLIADEPVTAARRMTALLEDYKDTGVGQSALDNRRSATNKLLRYTHTSAVADVCPETLRAWRQAPPVIPRVLGPAPARRTEGPSLLDVRRRLRDLDAQIAARLRLRPGETEAEALERIAPTNLRLRGVVRPLRARALIETFAATGARAGAVAEMRWCHLLAAHPRKDGRSGPALVVPAIKGKPARVKPLPDGLYDHLAAHRRCIQRICESEGRAVGPDSALFPGYLTQPDKLPCASSLTRFMRGSADGKQKPYMTRGDGTGVTCHSLRHTSATLIQQGAGSLPRASEDSHAFPFLDLITHDRDDVRRRRYLDVCMEHQIEHLSGLGVLLAYERIATDKGARRGRDVGRYRMYLGIHSLLVQHRRALVAAQTGPETGSQRLQREDLEAAIAAVAEELRRLREDDDALVAVGDEIDEPDIVLDLRAVEEDLRSSLYLDGPLQRDWLTVTELCELCGVSRPHLGACWRQGRPLGTADGRQPFGDGPVVLDDSIGEGERRRRIALADLDPAFLREPVREAKIQILLRELPKWWSQEACAMSLHPCPRTPEELDFS
jgi:integrase